MSQERTHESEFSLSAGVYMVQYTSSGGAGTGELQHNPQGEGWKTVTDSDKTGDQIFKVTVGSAPGTSEAGASKYRFSLGGDMKAFIFPAEATA